MKVLVTGGAGFVGSHIAEFYANKGDEVVCIDNLSRSQLLKKEIDTSFNWNYLSKIKNVQLIKGDVRDFDKLKFLAKDASIIVHTAAQTAVTTSILEPRTDFEINLLGTFNILEAARLSNDNPALIYCSTNKVYGDNVNEIKVEERATRYSFEGSFKKGVSETFSIDSCEHTPYGCSKLSGDLYAQDYTYLYGLKTGVFRMSCIYGTRQFGVEDQGWIAWFIIATLLGKPITIYGNGKQVRDVLYISDLIRAFDLFVNSKLKRAVINIGGGTKNTLSLLELIDLLQKITKRRSQVHFGDWRASDQMVYVSDISAIKEKLGWVPKISPQEGIYKVVEWVDKNIETMRTI